MRIPPCGNYGDIDEDGYVTRADAVLATEHAARITTISPDQVRRADVDGSGDVTLRDGIIIGKYAEGAEGYETFPICSGYTGATPITAAFGVVLLGVVILYILTR